MRKTLLLLRLLGSPRDWPNPIEVNSFIIQIAYIENDHHAPFFFGLFVLLFFFHFSFLSYLVSYKKLHLTTPLQHLHTYVC